MSGVSSSLWLWVDVPSTWTLCTTRGPGNGEAASVFGTILGTGLLSRRLCGTVGVAHGAAHA
jgi:hypothetical protein